MPRKGVKKGKEESLKKEVINKLRNKTTGG
jgi:hypothetical protein